MILVLLIAASLLLVLAVRYGADTRDGRDWQTRDWLASDWQPRNR